MGSPERRRALWLGTAALTLVAASGLVFALAAPRGGARHARPGVAGVVSALPAGGGTAAGAAPTRLSGATPPPAPAGPKPQAGGDRGVGTAPSTTSLSVGGHAASPVALGPAARGWTSLTTIAGSGDGHSAVFHLRGIDTQLRYVSDSASMVVYLVDTRRGLDASAGYADVDCNGPCRDDHMPLVDGAGDYELAVRATGGSWAVSIEEYGSV